jgi:hypothetical protein
MMRNIELVRRWLIVICAILVALNVAAAVLLLSPAGRSRAAKEEQYQKLRLEMLDKRRETVPARDMDVKLASAHEQVKAFYGERLAKYYSEVSEALGKEASANHVQLAAVRYETGGQAAPGAQKSQTGLQPLNISVDVDGNYADQMRFLNSLERSKLFFIPVQISFGGQQQQGSLRVSLRLQTFLRTDAS